ncbi:MAG: enoyl-CoA hydratase [candidate division KSB1 bacterium]|nr:enoyl-CoA hydratase [candidate division KSB1 bacterium]MDQ7066189.1 enoyl-CoA hydratase [candidate division KSB1 bacterium]
MSEHIRIETQDRIAVLQFNRPERKNAITLDMYRTLTRGLHEADADPAIRVLVLRGTEDCFTAGNDIQDFLNVPLEGQESPAVQFMLALMQLQKPIVAAVNGVAIGIGATMLLHCDLVYATGQARLQFPFVNLGLCPEAGSSLLLPYRLGHNRAAELLYFGEPVDAQRAYELGLVNAILPEKGFFDAVLERAQKLVDQPPAALRTTKALLRQGMAALLQKAVQAELKEFAAMLKGPEAKEAFEAFLQKRKPDFSRFA